MSRTDDPTEEPEEFEAGRILWQRCRTADMAESEPERLLDLAGFADGLLDDEEHDRVAAWVAADPLAASDVAAAVALTPHQAAASDGLDRIIGRAIAAIVDEQPTPRPIIPLTKRAPRRRVLQSLAQWGSLAAAVTLASWLGFAMGSGASLTLSQPGQNRVSDESFLPELLDPSTGFLRDFAEGQQT